MTSQTFTESPVAEAARRTRIQEAMFDDFFARKLPGDGYTIEKIAGEYRISTDQPSPFLPANDAPSSAASPMMGGRYA